MTQPAVIRVFEHESLTLGRLTPSELDKLYAFNDRNNNVFFTGIRNGIKFKNYVGVIQIGRKTIEILPKADRTTKSREPNERDLWQQALIGMLNLTHKVKVQSMSEAALMPRMNSILDMYFQIYLDEVKTLLHRGLLRQYRKATGNLKVVKGRILFGEQVKKNYVHQERVYSEHQVYDADNLYNQILLKALNIISGLSAHPLIRDQIQRLKLDFPDMKQVAITAAHFDRLKENRKTKPYQTALQIARMIILNYQPDIRAGSENMIALLFNMNKLWEEYIYRVLQRALQSDDYELSYNPTKKFWKDKTIRPDMVIKHGATHYVIDAKWKVPAGRQPSDADLKQMFAYNLYWKATQSMLLYPGEESPKSGKFHEGLDGNYFCKVGFIHVLDKKGNLDLGIGQQILKKLFTTNNTTPYEKFEFPSHFRGSQNISTH